MDMQSEEERLAVAGELDDVALQLFQPAADPATAGAVVAEEYARLQDAASLFAWPELAAVLQDRQAATQSEAAPDLLDAAKFSSWLELTALVLREPESLEHLPLLSAELMDEAWPEPLPATILQDFLLSLRLPEPDDATSAETATEETETADSASKVPELAFADDVHPELLAAYLEETPGHVAEAARLMREVAQGKAGAEQRNQASRLVHTLKGSSAVVGANALADFAHRLEDILGFKLQTVPQDLANTLEAAADCLESLFENLGAATGLPDEYESLQQELAAWHAQLAQDEDSEEPPIAVSEPPSPQQLAGLLGGLDLSSEQAVEQVTSGNETAAPAQALGMSEARIRRLLNLTGELIASSSQTAELLNQAGQLGRQLYRQDEQLSLRLDELDNLLEQQGQHLAKPTPQAAESQQHPDFDALELESYSNLQSTVSLLNEAAADSREMAANLQQCVQQMKDEFYQQQRVQRQLSEAVLATRMMPVSTLVPRLERIVRETCRKTGKQATVQIEGQQLQVDSDILKGITDPLLHLLRNAVDHGIETPQQRLAQGKSETGIIRLKFEQNGNYISLMLEDDGAGMDTGRIRERALERGLITADSELDEQALLRLTLQPGFSTREGVSEVSGRGVGMDVVQAAITRLRGALQLSSTTGQGSRFYIELPQTLIATHALVVRAAGSLLAIPADRIEQLLYVPANEQTIDEQGWRIETERYQLPVQQLAHLLHWNGKRIEQPAACTLMIVRHEPQPYALYVEEILPSRDIVIKSLAPWLDDIPGLQGACVLANGAVAPVLDMVRLLQDVDNGVLVPQAPSDTTQAFSGRSRSVATLLVVDDSLSNRKSMRMMLEGMGYGVHTAVDGLDALQVLNHTDVDMVLTDLEMPRMNGLDMVQAIRIWPERKHLPIVMITSRSTRKHREQAAQAGVDGYLTKPVQVSELQAQLHKWLDTTSNPAA